MSAPTPPPPHPPSARRRLHADRPQVVPAPRRCAMRSSSLAQAPERAVVLPRAALARRTAPAIRSASSGSRTSSATVRTPRRRSSSTARGHAWSARRAGACARSSRWSTHPPRLRERQRRRLMRQALTQALWHADAPRAFGRRLVEQPLMRNVLADLALDVQAATALMIRTARCVRQGRRERARGAFARIAHPGREVLGDQACAARGARGDGVPRRPGYVEETILPRLFRESPVNAIWEGTGNVICLDTLRALRRAPEALDALLDLAHASRFAAVGARGRAARAWRPDRARRAPRPLVRRRSRDGHRRRTPRAVRRTGRRRGVRRHPDRHDGRADCTAACRRRSTTTRSSTQRSNACCTADNCARLGGCTRPRVQRCGDGTTLDTAHRRLVHRGRRDALRQAGLLRGDRARLVPRQAARQPGERSGRDRPRTRASRAADSEGVHARTRCADGSRCSRPTSTWP